MNINFINALNKNFWGGNIKLVAEKNFFLFSSKEYLVFFNFFDKKLKSFDLGLKSSIINFDVQSNGKLAVILFQNNYMILLDIAKNRINSRVKFKNQCSSVKWSPLGKFFASSVANFIQIWKSSKNTDKKVVDIFLTYSLTVNCSQLWDFNWDQSGKTIIAGGNDFIVRIFYLRNKSNSKTGCLLRHVEELHLVKFCGVKNEFWVLTRKNLVEKFTISRQNAFNKSSKLGESVSRLNIYSYQLKRETGLLTVSELKPESSSVIQGYSNGILVLFEIPNNKIKFSGEIKNGVCFCGYLTPFRKFDFFKVEISSVSASNDFKIIVIGSYKDQKIFVLEKYRVITLLSQKQKNSDFTTLSISPNNKMVCTGDSGGTLRIWSLNLGLVLLFFRNHFKKISRAIFMRKTSRFIISCSLDGVIKIFDLKKSITIKTLENLERPVEFKFFDINYSNKLLISSCTNTNDICIWSLISGNLKEILKNNSFNIFNLKFLEKKNAIISIDKNGILKVWLLKMSQNFFIKINCRTIHMNIEFLASTFNPVSNEFMFLSSTGQILFLNCDSLEISGTLSYHPKNFSKKFDKKENVLAKVKIQYSQNGKFILFIDRNQTLLFSRDDLGSSGSLITEKANEIKNNLPKDYFPEYLKKIFLSADGLVQKNLLQVESFFGDEKWIFLFSDNIILLGTNKVASQNCQIHYLAILKFKEKFTFRILQKLFFKKHFFFLKMSFQHFPPQKKLLYSLALLKNSLMRQTNQF